MAYGNYVTADDCSAPLPTDPNRLRTGTYAFEMGSLRRDGLRPHRRPPLIFNKRSLSRAAAAGVAVTWAFSSRTLS